MASRIRTHLLLHTLHGLENESAPWSMAAWQPRVDVYEMTDSIVVLVEAPGLQLENLKLDFEPGQLVVEGVRTRPALPESARVALVEMQYGSFRRRFALPADADGEGISATYDAGIVTISVPRHEKKLKREIRVEMG
ncbi:MAG TPA: Hsp20/alpha crystallin family protein [Abditibacterium sp.]|jgi:HSP20 family protein